MTPPQNAQAQPPEARAAYNALLTALLGVLAVSLLSAMDDRTQLDRHIANTADIQHRTKGAFSDAAAHGNFVMRFANMNPADRGQLISAFQMHAWAIYTAFPRRVFMGERQTPVGLGFQGQPFPFFDPDEAWLREQDVADILTLEFDPQTSQIRFFTKSRGGAQTPIPAPPP